MGFFSRIARVVRRTVTRPVRTISGIIKNPTKKILPANLRNSKGWAKFGRPVVKVGSAVAIGAATGGIGLAGGSVVFTGLSTAGAITAGTVSAVSGGLSSKAFQPLKDIALPAAAGLVGGNAWRSRVAIKSYAQKLFSAELKRASTNFLSPKALAGQAAGLLNNLNKPKPKATPFTQPQGRNVSTTMQANNAALTDLNKIIKQKQQRDQKLKAALIGGSGGAVVAGPVGAAVGAAIGYIAGGTA